MVINKKMNFRRKLYFRWLQFLSRVQERITSILEEHETPKIDCIWPLTMAEWFEHDYDSRLAFKRLHYQNRLTKLKEDVKRTLQYNNFRLTHDQILQLEDIKRNLRLLHE